MEWQHQAIVSETHSSNTAENILVHKKISLKTFCYARGHVINPLVTLAVEIHIMDCYSSSDTIFTNSIIIVLIHLIRIVPYVIVTRSGKL